MNDFNFVDAAPVGAMRETRDGYIVAQVRCARTGIQYYNGDEVGRPDFGVVAIYRPEAEVFAADSLKSYVGRPLTDQHPPEPVTAKNWKKYAAGDIGQEIMRDGEYVSVPITMMDQAAIDSYKGGRKELSMGYTHNIEFVDGVAPCGTPYQGVSRNLRMNHIALVDKGRAGHECRVGDSANSAKWGASPITFDNDEVTQVDKPILKNVIVDGLSVQTTDQGAQAIDKLQKDNAALQAKLDAKDTDHAKALSAKDAELDAKDEKIKKLEDSQLSDADIDKRVADRAELVQKAKTLASDADFAGMSDDEVRKAAVVAIVGDKALEGKDQHYINARFDIECENAADSGSKNAGGAQAVADAVKDSKGKGGQQAQDNGQAAYEQSLQDAWKNGGDN